MHPKILEAVIATRAEALEEAAQVCKKLAEKASNIKVLPPASIPPAGFTYGHDDGFVPIRTLMDPPA
jgi:hypothetical protein